MIKSLIFTNDLAFKTLYHSLNDVAVFLAIEAIDWSPDQYEDLTGFDEEMVEAFASIRAKCAIDSIPKSFANVLDSIIKRANATRNEYRGVNYSGVALTNQSISVCTAGLTRVHLVKDGQILSVTRDHNIVSDSTEIPDEAGLKVSPDQALGVFLAHTRTLGFQPPSKPPEAWVWTVEGDYTILVVSQRFHQFREASDYVGEFLGPRELWRSDEELGCRGLIAKFEYLSTRELKRY